MYPVPPSVVPSCSYVLVGLKQKYGAAPLGYEYVTAEVEKRIAEHKERSAQARAMRAAQQGAQQAAQIMGGYMANASMAEREAADQAAELLGSAMKSVLLKAKVQGLKRRDDGRIYYEIVTWLPTTNTVQGGCKQLSKRYSDFHGFRQRLVGGPDGHVINVMPFPSKIQTDPSLRQHVFHKFLAGLVAAANRSKGCDEARVTEKQFIEFYAKHDPSKAKGTQPFSFTPFPLPLFSPCFFLLSLPPVPLLLSDLSDLSGLSSLFALISTVHLLDVPSSSLLSSPLPSSPFLSLPLPSSPLLSPPPLLSPLSPPSPPRPLLPAPRQHRT
jgi:hypothetical protein